MPLALANASQWPAQLKCLIESHGLARVWQEGLRVLGFPPNLAHTTAEAELVLAALERDGLLAL